MGVSSYRDLEVWQASMTLVRMVYEVVEKLPQKERFALADQIRRAAISIPSNIAEGFGRDAHRDFAHFLLIGRGSLYELETQLDIATMMGYVTIDEDLKSQLVAVSKMLGAFIRKLRTSDQTKHQAPSTKH